MAYKRTVGDAPPFAISNLLIFGRSKPLPYRFALTLIIPVGGDVLGAPPVRASLSRSFATAPCAVILER